MTCERCPDEAVSFIQDVCGVRCLCGHCSEAWFSMAFGAPIEAMGEKDEA